MSIFSIENQLHTPNGLFLATPMLSDFNKANMIGKGANKDVYKVSHLNVRLPRSKHVQLPNLITDTKNKLHMDKKYIQFRRKMRFDTKNTHPN